MRTRTFLFGAAAAAFLSAGCGPQFDPASKVQSLRIFGVQKSEPYGKPGTTEHLTMLWDDAPDKAGRDVQVAWFAGCNNPDGDLYYSCFDQLAQASGGGGASGGGASATCTGTPPLPKMGVGTIFNSYDFTIPKNIVDCHPPPKDPRQPAYGLSYVFFAACAGTLDFDASQDFPIVCKDQSGKLLGADDFVAGYTAIYSYAQFTNANPTIQGFSFNGVELTQVNQGGACTDDNCVSPAPDPQIACDAQETAVPCVPACADDGGDKCPEYSIKPSVPKSVVEQDDVAAARGDSFQEQMWIRYYADGGSLKSQVRLLNDAIRGWNPDYGTTFRAPKKKGVVHIWAVAQDNRGGTSWIRVPVVVQ